MAQADGSVLIITEIDTDGVVKGTKKIKGTLEDIGEGAKKTSKQIDSGLVDAFKKVAAVIAATGVVNKIKEFADQSIELGSNLQEVQNVVDVTFTTMSDKVDEFAKAAAATAGLSETMAKKYVGTFGAMADSFGFAEAEAYEMSTALTQLAGDLASFYNISQDEAYTKLKSVFTGETETLKELGVVMTQTALDAYAMANGFGKVTSEMTEQEKVALRYQFVMDQLSGASGDFVRTQESWANQTRVLELQWQSFMAVIGQCLINVLSPLRDLIIDNLVPGLEDLGKALQESLKPKPSDLLNDSLKKLNKTIKNSGKQLDETAKEIEMNAALAAAYKEELQRLEEAGLKTEESQRQYAAIIERLNRIYPDLNLLVDEQTGLLNAESKARLDNIETMKEEAYWRAHQEQYTAILEEQANATVAVERAEMDLYLVQQDRLALEHALCDQLGITEDQLYATYNAQSQMNNAMKMGGDHALQTVGAIQLLSGETVILTEEQMRAVEQLIKMKDEEGNLTKSINEGKRAIAATSTELEKYNELLGITSENTSSMEGATVNSMNNMYSITEKKLSGMKKEFSTAWVGMKDIAVSEIDEIQAKIDSIAGKTFSIVAETVKHGGLSGGDNFHENYYPSSASVASVPMLATGAVIPPGKPFLAMLGDQRNGMNIEAPLSTIEDALRNVLAEGSIDVNSTVTFQGDIASLVRLLLPEIRTEVERVGTSLGKVLRT